LECLGGNQFLAATFEADIKLLEMAAGSVQRKKGGVHELTFSKCHITSNMQPRFYLTSIDGR
jgi:hypothetical protein